ncbi:hypothetical protein BU17DRAFT_68310 [Hysterangium stoloniferum]|nr:hypothetical protein BU17DRAFT_68310 [Hysterangium stoloniferum]
MSPCPSRATPNIVVRTPRYASKRLRLSLVNEIRKIAKQRGIHVDGIDTRNLAVDPTHPLGTASDNASEWNSLLVGARAERGPQWDVSTQRFMVDCGSRLFFDPSPLAIPDERTPPPEDPTAADGSPSDPSWQPQDQHDPRIAAQFAGSSMSTPLRTSVRFQQQGGLNGHSHNGVQMGNPYPYNSGGGGGGGGMQNGRTPSYQGQGVFYDGGQPQAPLSGMGSGMGAMGSPMMGRQIGLGHPGGIGMGVEYGGGMPETPTPEMRRRTRSHQDGHQEMGW